MADNTALNSGSGGNTIRTDDNGGVHYPVTKIELGTDGTFSGFVCDTLPMPVGANTAKAGGGTTYNLLCDSDGHLQIDVLSCASHAVTNAGTFVVQVDGAALTALQLLDDTVATLGTTTYTETTTKGTVIGAVRNDTLAALADTDNEIAPLQVNSSGALYVAVDGTVTVAAHAVTNAGTFAVQISDTSFAVADGNALGEGVLVQGDDGSDRKNIHVDATTGDVQVDVTNTVTVDLGSNNDVTINGSSIVHATDAAHSNGQSGVPLLAVRDDEQAAMTPADGDYAVVKCDQFGNLKTTQLPDATSVVKFAVINAASGDNEIVAAIDASTKIRVLSALLIAGGTTDARFESAAGGTALTGIMKLIVNTGFNLPYNPAGWFETADNAALSLECTGDIDGCISYVEV